METPAQMLIMDKKWFRRFAAAARRKTAIEITPMTFKGGSFTLAIADRLCTLVSDDGTIKVAFTEAKSTLLIKLLSGKANREEIETLRGLSLFVGHTSLIAYTNRFMQGQLSLRELARVIFKKTAFVQDRKCIVDTVEWLKRNGFKHMSSELIFNKAIF